MVIPMRYRCSSCGIISTQGRMTLYVNTDNAKIFMETACDMCGYESVYAFTVMEVSMEAMRRVKNEEKISKAE